MGIVVVCIGVLGGSAGSLLRAPIQALAVSDAVTLLQPDTLHANGAELSWTQYTGPSGAPFQDYEVHRSLTPGFTPSPADLLATIYDQSTTWYTDTTAGPGVAFSYIVVANSSPSNEVTVTLPAAGQSTKVLQPGTDGLDTYIGSGTNALTCANHGASDPLVVGTDASDTWRSLVDFDLADIPVGATVTSATLALYHPYALAVGGTVATYPLTTAWSPGSGDGACTGDGATWNEGQGSGASWQTPGGDYDATGGGGTVATGPGEQPQWHNFALTAMVQSWVNADRPNLGVLLKLIDESQVQGKRVDYLSAEDSNPALRPKLAVSYTDGSTAIAPTVSLVSPAPGSYVRGNAVTVSAAAAAAHQVSKVEFYVDGSLAGTSMAAPYSQTWDTTTSTNGSHTLTAKAYDDASNVTTSAPVSVSVANYAPTRASIAFPTSATVNPGPRVAPVCALFGFVTTCSFYYNGTAQGTVPVVANVTSDPNVTVTKVDFFLDGQPIGTAIAPPYGILWNTLDPQHPAFDGVHTLTAEAWDSTGLGTYSAADTVTVDNSSPLVPVASGSVSYQSLPTEFQASFATSGVPDTLTYDPSLPTQAVYPVTVTITNSSSKPWPQSSVFLHYRWYSLSVPSTVTDSLQIPLGQDVAAGQSVTVTVNVSPPTLDAGVDTADYRLQFDLNDQSYTAATTTYGLASATSSFCPSCGSVGFTSAPQTTGIWFASMGNAPAESSATVIKASPPTGGFGIQPYYQYLRTPLGAGMEQLTNVASGNSLVHFRPFNDPGVGLATVVDLTYNGGHKTDLPGVAGTNWSLSISGLTDLGRKLQGSSQRILFFGGDGAMHQLDDARLLPTPGDPTVYTERAGDHLYGRLRCPDASNPSSCAGSQPLWQRTMWTLTRPDRVVFSYNPYGYPLSVTDRYNNKLNYWLEKPAGDTSSDPSHYSQVFKVTDAKGAAFHLDYYTASDPVSTRVIRKIKDISDHSGHTLCFNYYDDGNLLSLVQHAVATCDPKALPARTWVFTYVDSNGQAVIASQADRWNPSPTTNPDRPQTGHLYSVIDPVGEATEPPLQHETVFGYCITSGTCSNGTSWALQQAVARDQGDTTATPAYDKTTFDYGQLDGSGNGQTTMTAPRNRITTYTYVGQPDAFQAFLVTKIVDPLAQVRDLVWSSDYQLSKLYEPRLEKSNGSSTPFIEFRYDDNGYLTDRFDPQETWDPNLVNRNHITLTYSHVAVDPQDVAANWRGRTVAHSSELLSKQDASLYTWTFCYDNSLNCTSSTNTSLTSIQDPTQDQTDRTQLAYNTDGTLASSTDAKNNKTVFNSYDPNGSGQPSTISDPLGKVTKVGYDLDGRVKFIQDPRHAALSGGDPQLYQTQFFYDAFERLTQQSTTKQTIQSTSGTTPLIWTDTVYDANDNIVTQYVPHYSGTTDDTASVPFASATYDAMDRITLQTGPDTSSDPAGQRTQYFYDRAGDLRRVVLPVGVQSGSGNPELLGTPTAHAIDYTYDPLNRVIEQTQYLPDPTSPTGTGYDSLYTDSCYSLTGDLVRVTQPLAKLNGEDCSSASAPQFTTVNAYGDNHRLTSTQDPRGDLTTYFYNPNGTTSSVIDALGNAPGGVPSEHTTTYTYDGMQRLTAESDPFMAGHPVVTMKTYDKVGNLTKLISPRAYDASTDKQTFSSYVTSYTYDGDNRLVQTDLPTSTSYPEQDHTYQAYDPDGYLTTTTLPDPASGATPALGLAAVPSSKKTTIAYFDPGWVQKTVDGGGPDAPNAQFGYQDTAAGCPVCALGQQTIRVPFASGHPIPHVSQAWSYYPDGKTKQRKEDAPGTTGIWTYNYDADNDLTSTRQSTTGSPIDIQAGYDALDRLVRTDHKKKSDSGYDFTSFAYDLNGNVAETHQDGTESTPGSTNPSNPGRDFGYEYDGGNWLLDECADESLSAAPGHKCDTPATGATEQKIAESFNPNGWETNRTIYQPSSGSWSPLESIQWQYNNNGKLSAMTTQNGNGMTLENHAVSYVSSGIYNDGYRVADAFGMAAPPNTTPSPPCQSVLPAPPTCTATYTYDARDRVVSEFDGHQNTTTYTMDTTPPGVTSCPYPSGCGAGNIMEQTVNANGSTASDVKYTYTGNQLQSKTDTHAIPQEQYFYDSFGRLQCVTDPSGSFSADCNGTSPTTHTLRIYQYNFLDNLSSFQDFSGATLTGAAQYTYDALQRNDTESEQHPFAPSGTDQSRFTVLSYLGLTNDVNQEQQYPSQTAPPLPPPTTTKNYTYDVYGHRIGMSDSQSGKTYTYGYNVHDSTSLLVDASGNSVAATYAYGAYGQADGKLTNGDPNSLNPINAYRYAGKRYDSGSATLDMQARRFGPDISHFLQQDYLKSALGDLGLGEDPLTQNRYDLAGGNPLSFIEAAGHVFINDGGGTASTNPNPGCTTQLCAHGGGYAGPNASAGPGWSVSWPTVLAPLPGTIAPTPSSAPPSGGSSHPLLDLAIGTLLSTGQQLLGAAQRAVTQPPGCPDFTSGGAVLSCNARSLAQGAPALASLLPAAGAEGAVIREFADAADVATGLVDYGSTGLSRAVQAQRLLDNNKLNNYAAALLDNGAIITARSAAGLHAEESLIAQAHALGEPITNLYSELEPCANTCQALTQGMNVSWSWAWNGVNRAAARAAQRSSVWDLFGGPG